MILNLRLGQSWKACYRRYVYSGYSIRFCAQELHQMTGAADIEDYYSG